MMIIKWIEFEYGVIFNAHGVYKVSRIKYDDVFLILMVIKKWIVFGYCVIFKKLWWLKSV